MVIQRRRLDNTITVYELCLTLTMIDLETYNRATQTTLS